jgi:hypothetical protein
MVGAKKLYECLTDLYNCLKLSSKSRHLSNSYVSTYPESQKKDLASDMRDKFHILMKHTQAESILVFKRIKEYSQTTPRWTAFSVQ